MGSNHCLRPNALRKLGNGSLRILPFEEIDNRVRSGAYQFHDFGSFWIWTQVSEHAKERTLDVVLLLGDGFVGRESEAVERLSVFAKEHGCAAIEAISRKGLAPTLKPIGFKTTRVLLRKDL